MKAQAPLQRFEIFGMFGQFGEQLHLHGAQQRFGSPEAQADLQNMIGVRQFIHDDFASGR